MMAGSNKERPAGRSTVRTECTHAASETGAGGAGVVVVGASTRAFAQSAVRAGWAVRAADLFGDVDLRRAAVEVIRVRGDGPAGYPLGLPAAIASWPDGPCVYTGALENHPGVIESIGRSRPLAGCTAATVAAVRDHDRLAAVVRDSGLSFPETRADPRGLPRDGSWLVKPIASAGGRGIARWQGDADSDIGGAVWQRFVGGATRSAVYVADAAGCRLLGVTSQLVGRHWCRAAPFAFCGAVEIPPSRIDAASNADLHRLGGALAAAFGLVGLFNVDLVVAPGVGMHVVEVNPRPSGSMELVERSTGASIAALHLAACGFRSPTQAPTGPAPRGVWSKAVLFAPRDRASRPPPPRDIDAVAATWSAVDTAPAVADVPAADEPLPAGGPILTVFARGESPARSLATLRRRVARLRRLCDDVSPPAAAPPDHRRWRRGSTA